MTRPSPETREREKDKLYVTDAELARRLGVPDEYAKPAIAMLDADPRSGFPQKSKVWGDRRYWPAVRAYFDWINGVTMDGAARFATENRSSPHPAAALPPMRTLSRRSA